ncbi:fungal-specific transcription factor domain-containing protein [Phascolomyces articulosus]|uniref:Fungal-specific transcription factor domain-containing protein n=1 Tax=Phascolomyces articulosus TaxID=60185 RepID=A0AAD5PHF3_9FUNG|nr:fungal-specific transcription factor domain-containing protein [Phascolomyces articulosus]
MSLSQICFADDVGSPQQSHQRHSNHESNSNNNNNNKNESTPSSPDSVGDSTGQLSMDENGQVRYLGKSSGYHLLQNSRAYQNGAFHFTGWGHKFQSTTGSPPAGGKSNSKLDPLELPPKDLSRHLINLYFEHFYPILPLFYKKRLTSSLNSPLEPISPLLLNAIYAVASRVSPDVRVRTDPASPDTAGDVFFERAKRLLDDYYDVPRISTVQALLLLATHQHGTMKYVRGWLYSGMAFRMALDLGLHRNCDHWNIPPDERERRKRVFWCCFVVDRLISAIYGRTATFEERDCDVPFPINDDEVPTTSSSTTTSGDDDASNDMSTRPKIAETFVHLIQITDILGHVLRNVYYAKARHHASQQHLEHVLTGLNRELTNWYNRLPPALQYKPPNTESGETAKCPPLAIAQIHLFYYTTLILLHRPFIPGNSSQSPSSLPSYKICISAARSILDIVNIMFSENKIRYVINYAVYCLFTAGIMFIKMASTDEADKVFDAKIYINKIMRALDEIDRTWMNAARCCNILGELAGLRDINLECDDYSPRPNNRLLAQPPPSIAVPNSPQPQQQMPPSQQQPTENQANSQVPDNQHHVNMMNSTHRKQATTVDAFAAPDVIANAQQQFDPFHTAFWGVPSSLDVDEWNHYFGSQSTLLNVQNSNNNTATAATGVNTTGSASATVAAVAAATVTGGGEADPSSLLSPSSAQPLIPSHEFSPMQHLRGPYSGEPGNHHLSSIPQHHELRLRQQQQRGNSRNLVNNNNVDILNGISFPVDLPESPASSVLLGLLANTATSARDQQQQQDRSS